MTEPYLPKHLPLQDIHWVDLVEPIAKATGAVTRYDGMLQSIPNPVILLSPLQTQEAVLSSKIEGTQASMEEVMEFEADPRKKVEPEKHADIQEIINYRRAMGDAVLQLKERPLCLNLLKSLHSVLLDSVRGQNKAPGEFRRIQNYIGPPGCSIEEASFVPPAPDKLMVGLDNWEKYAHQHEKSTLVQLAVLKAQFEILHPFLDGNGRIGRMLVPLFLYEKGVLSSPMFYLSAYFERNRDEYYYRLRSISQKDDWNGWILFFLRAVEEQAFGNVAKTQKILALYDEMKQVLPSMIKSQYAIQVVDVLFTRPIFKISDFIAKSKINAANARRIVAELKRNDILMEIRPAQGRQASILGFQKLLEIIT